MGRQDFADHIIIGDVTPLGPDGARKGLHEAGQITTARLRRRNDRIRGGGGVHREMRGHQVQLDPQPLRPAPELLQAIGFAAVVAVGEDLTACARKQGGGVDGQVADRRGVARGNGFQPIAREVAERRDRRDEVVDLHHLNPPGCLRRP